MTTNPEEVLIAIRVREADLELPDVAAAKEVSAEAVRVAATTYASSLMRDLALPAAVVVTVEPVGEDVFPQALPFSMRIGGDCARINLRLEKVRIHDHLAVEIYRNRALLVTPAAARAFAAGIWPTERLSAYSEEKLLELMRACVERNINLARLTEVLRPRKVADLWDTWELVFAVHREQDLRLSVSFHPERHREVVKDASAGLKLEDRFAALQRRIFDKLGLLSPIAAVSAGPELARSEWYTAINDVRLPLRVLRAADDFDDVVAGVEEDLLADPLLLLTRDGVKRSLDLLRETAPVLVEQVSKRICLNTICVIVGGLVQEGIPIHNLGRILDVLSFVRGWHDADSTRYIVFSPNAETPIGRVGGYDGAATAEDYLRVVRNSLRREITHVYMESGTAELPVHLIDPQTEQRIQIAEEKPFTTEERMRLIRGFADASLRNRAVVLTSDHARDRLWSLIHYEFPDVAVLSYGDLSPDCNLRAVDRISLVED